MTIENVCKCGHLESEHEEYGVIRPCNHKDYWPKVMSDSEHCVCYNFVNVKFESALGHKNLGEI